MHSSRRNLALLLLIGLTAGLIVLWLLGRGSAPDEARDTTPPTAAAGAPSTLAEPVAPAAAEAATVDRQTVAEPAQAAEDPAVAAPTLNVRVVGADGGPPAGPATVLLPCEEIPQADREAHRDANHDQQLDGWGREFPCDAEGRATIPMQPGNWFPIGAREGALWGRTNFERIAWREGEEVVVVLKAAVHVSVIVLDEDRRPVAGAPVAYRADRANDVIDLAHARTNAEGRADLRHLGESIAWQGPHARRHTVALALPFDPAVRADFDPAAPPREPLLLVLPAHGAVEVQVLDADGEPFATKYLVGLQLAPPGATAGPSPGEMNSQTETGSQRAPLRDGVARFERVGLGLLIECGIDFGDGFTESLIAHGPQRAGETARVTLRRAALERPSLHGRLLDASGQPMAGEILLGKIYPPDSDRRVGTVRLKADAAGRFRAPLDLNELPSGELLLLAEESEPGRIRFLAARFSLPLPPGGGDLGDLTFGAPLAAAGVALGPDGELRNDAQFELGPESAARGWNEAATSPFHNLQGQVDETGRFELLGPLPLGTWHLHAQVRRDSLLGQLVVPFQAGESDLRLQFGRKPGIRGRLLLDPIIPRDGVAVVLESADGSMHSGRLDERSGEFHLQLNRPGPHDLVVTARQTRQTLLRMSGVATDPQALVDVGDVDLRGRLQLSQLSVYDVEGAAVTKLTLWTEWSATLRPSFSIQCPLTLVRTDPVRLWVDAPGHLLTEVLMDEAQEVLRLEPGHAVRITCAGAPQDARWRLNLRLQPDEGVRRPLAQVTFYAEPGANEVQGILPAAGAWQAWFDWQESAPGDFRTILGALGTPPPLLPVQRSAEEQHFQLNLEITPWR